MYRENEVKYLICTADRTYDERIFQDEGIEVLLDARVRTLRFVFDTVTMPWFKVCYYQREFQKRSEWKMHGGILITKPPKNEIIGRRPHFPWWYGARWRHGWKVAWRRFKIHWRKCPSCCPLSSWIGEGACVFFIKLFFFFSNNNLSTKSTKVLQILIVIQRFNGKHRLAALVLIEKGMDPTDAILYVRERRRGAISARQVKFLQE